MGMVCSGPFLVCPFRVASGRAPTLRVPRMPPAFEGMGVLTCFL